MSDATPQVLRAPKLFWQTRRLDGHRDWPFAFWRELFQNSVDAKARNIEISIRRVARSGVFDRPSPGGEVIQVVFADDGTGMTEDTIRNVFLEPGRSTKGSGSGMIGGFGTARTLLCFSQDRYEIHTNGLVVEGDGSEYILSSREDAARRASTHGLDRFAANIERFSGRKGCIFVIDVDPYESEYAWRNVNESQLRRKLFEFLELSELKIDSIILDGDRIFTGLKKGQARKKLSAPGFPDFGTVHVSRNDRATQKGSVIIRVNGLAMFTERTDLKETQVILELDSSRTRQLLTDNRDGLKDNPDTALKEFLRELTVNSRQALRDHSHDKAFTLEGELGGIRIRPEKREQTEQSSTSLKTHGTTSWSEEIVHFSPEDQPGSFSSSSIMEHQGGKSEKSRIVIRRLHDFHMHIENIKGNPALENAARRWNPKYWRQQGERLEGRGRESHELLAAWTAACTIALRHVAELRPTVLLKEGGVISFVPGFIISSNKNSERSVRGLHKILSDGRHALLVNPILDDGKIAYDLRRLHDGDSKLGLQSLILTAIHEACHVIARSHNDEFANLLTTVAASVDYAKMGREILDAINSVRALYGAKEARIQSFEDLAALQAVVEDESIKNEHVKAEKVGRRKQRLRPAERALAAAYPVATSVLGALAAPENHALPADAARAALAQAIVPVTEMETAINVQILSKIDEELAEAARNDWMPQSKIDSTETNMSANLDDIDADLGGLELKADSGTVLSIANVIELSGAASQGTAQETENRQPDPRQSSVSGVSDGESSRFPPSLSVNDIVSDDNFLEGGIRP